ncbi:hypothetical protein [Afipia carboxidovorans]|uniref:hypothetical protein n=1 Tax=Afipia carboxidovorans TaxID=40137 RepID=UPI0030D5C621
MRPWATYIAMAALAGAAAAVAVIALTDGLLWPDEVRETPQPVSELKTDSEPLPLRSNADSKGDRLPQLADVSPSMTLETARHFMSAPVVAPAQPPVRATNALLDDKQIAALKARLRLTTAQEKYWPPVESALRELISAMHVSRRQPSSFDADHEAVKRLMAAAGPFLAQLRADQKGQIQSLMRMAGLGTELPGAN